MVLVSFSEKEFIPLIQSGKKRQTCRPYKERQLRILKDNPTLHLWYKSRTSERQKLGEVQRTGLTLIRLQPEGVKYLGPKLPFSKELFAHMDGFSDYDEMYSWFAKHYPDLENMEFVCIRWNPETLIPAQRLECYKTLHHYMIQE